MCTRTVGSLKFLKLFLMYILLKSVRIMRLFCMVHCRLLYSHKWCLFMIFNPEARQATSDYIMSARKQIIYALWIWNKRQLFVLGNQGTMITASFSNYFKYIGVLHVFDHVIHKIISNSISNSKKNNLTIMQIIRWCSLQTGDWSRERGSQPPLPKIENQILHGWLIFVYSHVLILIFL